MQARAPGFRVAAEPADDPAYVGLYLRLRAQAPGNHVRQYPALDGWRRPDHPGLAQPHRRFILMQAGAMSEHDPAPALHAPTGLRRDERKARAAAWPGL